MNRFDRMASLNSETPRRPGGWAILCAVCCAAAIACSNGATQQPDEGAAAAGGSSADAADDGHGRPENDCASCHPNHVAQWRISPHAYAMRDPVFHAMVRLGQKETEGKVDQFCTRCHSPIGFDDDETQVYLDEESGVYQQKTEGLSTEAMAGISCEVCHSISAIDETFPANAHFDLERDGVRRATIADPVESAAHESAYSSLHKDSEFCRPCHQVVSQFFSATLPLETTHTEWVQSTQKKECQGCHMSEYEGQAAEGGPDREVHEHYFTGVDVSLLPREDFPGYDEMRDRAEKLLQNSAELTVEPDVDQRALSVSIQNLAMHALPSGSSADREMWIELIVENAAGEAVFESGTLDDNGDLRVDEASYTTEPGTDPQLVLYTQRLYFDPKLEDPASTEPRRRVEFLWEPNVELDEDDLVRQESRDTRSYDLGSLPAGDYTANVRLLFRTFPPHLLRLLEEEAGLDPDVKDRVPTVEMERATVKFSFAQ